jgi:hypothetical protein
VSGQSASRSGITFVANLPTEEVFTIADRARVDGTVRATKPLSYGGMLIEDFTLTFAQGRVINVAAARGESVLRQMIDTDAGAARLGEIALVPHSSPISQSGLLFYNTLFDENAASARNRVQVHAARRRIDGRNCVRARRGESQRHPRRLHDRIGRSRRGRRVRRWRGTDHATR